MEFKAATKGGPTMLPMFPDSVVPRAKIRVRFLQGRVRRSLRVAPRGARLVQEVGRAVGGTPVKPLCGRLIWRAMWWGEDVSGLEGFTW